jgi:hypothetical protein
VYFVKIVILVLAGVIVLVNDWENDKRVAFCGDKRLKSNQKALAWKRSFKVMFQPVKQTGIFVNGVLRRDDEKCFAIVHRLAPRLIEADWFWKAMGNFGHIPKIDRSPHYFVASARHFGGSGLLFHWRSRKSWTSISLFLSRKIFERPCSSRSTRLSAG